MTGLGTDVSWTRCLTKWNMFLVQARLQIDNQGSRFGWWMRLFLGNMNSVLLSARCGWWKSGLFLATGAAGGLLEVPSRSRLILLSANGSSTLFAGISEGEIGKCLISRLLIVDGRIFPPHQLPSSQDFWSLKCSAWRSSFVISALLSGSSGKRNSCLGLNGSREPQSQIKVSIWLPA